MKEEGDAMQFSHSHSRCATHTSSLLNEISQKRRSAVGNHIIDTETTEIRFLIIIIKRGTTFLGLFFKCDVFLGINNSIILLLVMMMRV